MSPRRLTRTQRWTAYTLLAAIPLAITGLVTAVLGGAVDRVDEIPALVVNNDKMVTTTSPDGSTTPVLAGRLIVTELTGSDAPGFSWSLANEESAAQALADGAAYAVVTIPENFSASVASLSTANPVQADITLTTDDAHSYLAGSLAQSLGGAMTSALGQQLTKTYLSGLFATLGTFGGSISTAASGAQQIAGGVASLHDGLVTFSSGMASAASGAVSAASGAQQYVNGVAQYTAGVDALSAGLSQLNAGTSPLAAAISAYCPTPSALLVSCAAVQAMTVQEFSGILGGISGSASGAAQLAAGSPALRTGGQAMADGISDLAGGLKKLSTGAAESASGAGELATGAQGLADGLSQGAGQLSGAASDPDATAAVVAEPVTLSSTVLNPLDSVRDLIALLILPAALWLGALAIFVARRPFADSALQRTTGSFRIVMTGLLTAGALGAVQVALALTTAALVGVPASALLWAGVLALIASVTFIAIHMLLKLVWPRASNLVSMVLLIVQIVVLPGVLPSEMLPTWIQPISSAFPLTWAMNGMQAIVAGGQPAEAIPAALALLLVTVVIVAVTTWRLSQKRLSNGLGFVVARAA